MPRSYSYDHFQNPKKETHLVHRDEKAKYTESKPATGEAKIHYGHAHAQTEELLVARQMNVQLEELAGLKDEKAAPAKQAATAELPEAPELPKSAPIGALPVTEEPAATLPEGLLAELRDVTLNKLRLAQTAARDMVSATLDLARLPAELAMVAARHLRPTRA